MGKKILLVDDEANIRTSLADILEKLGYEVIQAANGQEALEKVDKEKPDLVLVDTKMPDMDGIEVCRQIKNIEGLNTKVIIYTGYIDAVDVTRARLAGADDYEVKTQDFGKLLSAVKKLIFRGGGGGVE
ncbi:MAG: response regulator, partial [Candidatus Omnitrophota bacterium]